MKLTLYRITMVVTASYLLLGIFSSNTAARLWWLYAIVTFVLAIASLVLEQGEEAREIRKERHEEDRRAVGPHHA